MKDFCFLTAESDSLFKRNLEVFCENMKQKNQVSQKEYCLFYPSFGSSKKEDIDFIIYGQAPKGWQPKFKIFETIDIVDLVKEAREYSNTLDTVQDNPIDWININWSPKTKKSFSGKAVIDYNAYRSFFWNVTYKLISDYKKLDRKKWDWSKHLVWSNLMKIAPAARTNPNNSEFNAQLEVSKELFLKEIEDINPRFVIFLTNWNWADEFVKDLGIKESKEGDWIQAQGIFKNTKIIVTDRIQKKQNSENCVREILELIKAKS